MRISDWSSDVCSSDLVAGVGQFVEEQLAQRIDVRLLAIESGQRRGVVPGARIQTGGCPRQRRLAHRSEERRVGKEGVLTCLSRCSPYHYTKNIILLLFTITFYSIFYFFILFLF